MGNVVRESWGRQDDGQSRRHDCRRGGNDRLYQAKGDLTLLQKEDSEVDQSEGMAFPSTPSYPSRHWAMVMIVVAPACISIDYFYHYLALNSCGPNTGPGDVSDSSLRLYLWRTGP